MPLRPVQGSNGNTWRQRADLRSRSWQTSLKVDESVVGAVLEATGGLSQGYGSEVEKVDCPDALEGESPSDGVGSGQCARHDATESRRRDATHSSSSR